MWKFWWVRLVIWIFIFGFVPHLYGESLPLQWAPLSDYKKIEEAIMGADFAHAKLRLQELQEKYPEDPSPPFFQSSLLEWECFLQLCSSARLAKITVLLEAAAETCQRLRMSYPKDVRLLTFSGFIHIRLAHKLAEQSEWFSAVRAAKRGRYYLEQAAWKDAEDSNIYLPLGGFYYFSDNLSWIGRALGFFLGLNGDREKGLTLMLKTATHPGPFQADAWYFLNMIYQYYEKDYHEANRYNEKLVHHFPRNRRFRHDQAHLAFKLGRREQAVEQYQKIIQECEQLGPSGCHPRFLFRSLLGLGEIEVERGNWTKALTFLDRAQAFESTASVEFRGHRYFLRGECYRHLNKKEQAIQAYQQSIQFKDYQAPHQELAQYHLEKLMAPE